MLKLKLQYFGHLMQTHDSLEKTLMLGKTEGKKAKREAEDETVRQPHQLNGYKLGQTLGEYLQTKEASGLESIGSQRVRHN